VACENAAASRTGYTVTGLGAHVSYQLACVPLPLITFRSFVIGVNADKFPAQ
jgi:hypothetical protein